MADDRTLPFRERAYGNYVEEMKGLKNTASWLLEKELDDIEDYRAPFSCDELLEITILLSCGGPADGYKIYLDKYNKAVKGFYFFADWFEYEQFKLTDEELDRVITVYPVSPLI